jgi:hypothetical protein
LEDRKSRAHLYALGVVGEWRFSALTTGNGL